MGAVPIGIAIDVVPNIGPVIYMAKTRPLKPWKEGSMPSGTTNLGRDMKIKTDILLLIKILHAQNTVKTPPK